MRTLQDHKTNPANAELTITVVDPPGQGGASHQYQIEYSGIATSLDGKEASKVARYCDISFQNRPIREFGVNGVTQEALLAIVIDRLRSFQAGPFSCRDNAVALRKCEEALMWLQRRTHERMRRGVEGTNQA